MPVIAQIMIPVEFNENGIVEILKEEINRCGCLDLVVESGVVCNDDGVCCTANVNNFAEKMKKFRED